MVATRAQLRNDGREMLLSLIVTVVRGNRPPYARDLWQRAYRTVRATRRLDLAGEALSLALIDELGLGVGVGPTYEQWAESSFRGLDALAEALRDVVVGRESASMRLTRQPSNDLQRLVRTVVLVSQQSRIEVRGFRT